MAKTPSGAVDPEKLYRVKVRRAIKLGKLGTTVLTPRNENVLKGKVLSTLPPEDVESYEAV